MSAPDWQLDRARFEADVASLASDAQPVLSSASGSILMARARFDAFEGSFQTTPRLMIALCISGGGRFLRSTDLGQVQGIMRAGNFAIALPNTPAEGLAPAAEMLGLSIGETELANFGISPDGVDLHSAASAIRSDPLISAVMKAIWLDAETNGMNSLFLQEGISVILKRLSKLEVAPSSQVAGRRINSKRLAHIRELIESRLGDDINIADLAREARLDVRSFTRAFRAATGVAPYIYLTTRRLERAKELLATSMSITEIAAHVGYVNPSKFAAAFRRCFGCPPREWRKASR